MHNIFTRSTAHRKKTFRFLLVLGLLSATSCWVQAADKMPTNSKANTFSCVAQISWVTSPNAPKEIPLGKNADFCQFYQFSWQWFLQLVSPNKTAKNLRNFEIQQNYPVLEPVQNNQRPNSCGTGVSTSGLVVTLNKSGKGMDIPDLTGQAGTFGKGIYDQNGNVVFYNVRFSRNLCDAGKIQAQPNFPAGTTEIKTAWKQLTPNDNANDYFIMHADIDGIPGEETLGLIGFHLVMATELHPEMIWATYEHIDNAPNCNNNSERDHKWSFASKACMQSNSWLVLPSPCVFNDAVTVAGIHGHTPTEICTSHLGGTDPVDPQFDKNSVALNDLNIQINAFLSELKPENPMAVFKHYRNSGALWLSDVAKPSFIPPVPPHQNISPLVSNQRGSLRIANNVMETTFQDGFTSSNGKNQGPYSSNCFGCHNYNVPPQRNTGPQNNFGLSHIFINDIVAGQCATPKDVNAGPIFSNDDAQAKCAKTCEKKGGWNGNWKTTQEGVMSVCACCNATP